MQERGGVGVTFATKAKTNLTDSNGGRFCFLFFPSQWMKVSVKIVYLQLQLLGQSRTHAVKGCPTLLLYKAGGSQCIPYSCEHIGVIFSHRLPLSYI